MAKDPLRNLVHLVSGLTEMTMARATAAASDLAALGGLDQDLTKKKLAKQVGSLAEEIMATAEANRKHVQRLVRAEVDAAAARLGGSSELASARAAISSLGQQVDELSSLVRGLVGGTAATTSAAASEAVATVQRTAEEVVPARVGGRRPTRSTFAAPAGAPAPARRSPARKAPPRKAAAGTASGATTTAAAKRTAAAGAPATKAPAKKAPAKKAPATKAPAKKASPAKGSSATPAAAKKAPPARKSPTKEAPTT